MATLQVRSIDDQLYKALKRRAARENRSISQEVVAILKSHLSRPATENRNSTDYFLEMAGSWQDSRSTEEIIGEIRQDRRQGERFSGDIF